jgi:23S rRNA (pseudouridine1915-N3)-methyltransferase
MEIIIKAIGREKSLEIKKLSEEYLKMTKWRISIEEFELNKTLPQQEQKLQEGKLLLNNIPSNAYVYTLDEKGKQFTSPNFAMHLNERFNHSKGIYFLIGGAYGHSQEVKARANFLLSLSDLTFPHKLARLFLIEQLYRTYAIINNHPYHK